VTVHYDKPVRELLADCVRDLRSPFTRQDVLAWFGEHYPRVKATTISTHLAGLTEGPRTNPNLAQHPPLVRRIDHGLYEATAQALGRGARPASRDDEASLPASRRTPPSPRPLERAQVLLVGCVKTKQTVPSPARELYTSSLFTRRRGYAEASGSPWYVLSARHGLVAPDEVIAPYDVHLASQPSSYRSAWGVFVAEQLRRELGSLVGLVVEVHAGDAYVDAVRRPLEAAGVTVVDPVEPARWGRRWPGTAASARGSLGTWRTTSRSSRTTPSQAAVAVLGDPEQAVPVPELLRSDRAAWSGRGCTRGGSPSRALRTCPLAWACR
jgi:hypothetical protein